MEHAKQGELCKVEKQTGCYLDADADADADADDSSLSDSPDGAPPRQKRNLTKEQFLIRRMHEFWKLQS